jgi:N-acetyl-alpha-D-muramate 1-phosphate uridylyltransferase
VSQVVVLAGGLGTRMLPHTERVPKALLEIAGRPFLGWLLPRLARSGADDVVLCIGHLGCAIRDYVGDGTRFGLRVRYADEGTEPLGTLGALVAARPLLDERFVVTYGDSYLELDHHALLAALDASPELDAAMAVWKNEDRLEPSNVAVEDGCVVRYDKRRSQVESRLDHIDFGATAMRRSLLTSFEPGVPSGLDALQTELARRRRLGAFVVHHAFHEIGSPNGRAALERHLAERGPPGLSSTEEHA